MEFPRFDFTIDGVRIKSFQPVAPTFFLPFPFTIKHQPLHTFGENSKALKQARDRHSSLSTLNMNPRAPIFKPSTATAVKATLKQPKAKQPAPATAARTPPVSEARNQLEQTQITPSNLEDFIRAKLERGAELNTPPPQPEQPRIAPQDFEGFIRSKLVRSMSPNSPPLEPPGKIVRRLSPLAQPFVPSAAACPKVQANGRPHAEVNGAAMPKHQNKSATRTKRQQLQHINFQAEDIPEEKVEVKKQPPVLTHEERTAWLQSKLAKARKDFDEEQRAKAAAPAEQPPQPEPRMSPVEIQLDVMRKIRKVGEAQRERIRRGYDGPLVVVGARVPSYFWAERASRR